MVRIKSRYILFSIRFPTQQTIDKAPDPLKNPHFTPPPPAPFKLANNDATRRMNFTNPDLPSPHPRFAPGSAEAAKAWQTTSDGQFLPGGPLANLPPAARKVVMRTPGPAAITSAAVNHAVRDAVNRMFGDLGAGLVKASLSLKYFSEATATGILRVSREHFTLAWAALTLLTEIAGTPVLVTVQHVSGTMKKCERAGIALDREMARVLEFELKREGYEATRKARGVGFAAERFVVQ
ncbi:ribonuclease P/MRP protein subunit [Myxozyma melibiosi]|uniref:Ribonuclease P/MRP protein subunit n=1 Tax=Myxozyma melibiosi TaxID=54550 RepID=A0ABR1F3A7_9ASCO